MSRRNSKVDSVIDTKYSSGDSNMTKPQEENNNQVDELSKELSKMGCIVDGVKRPPNICVENCVYEGSGDEKDGENDEVQEKSETDDEDDYSEEFEEDKSDEESLQVDLNMVMSTDHLTERKATVVQLSKSNSNVTVKPPGSLSGRSSGYSSFVPQTRRINMSFPNDRLREIERHNHILLNKILCARNERKSSIPPREQQAKKPVASAAVHRKQQQRKIDHDNMILLKKIQRAKSSSYSFRR